MVPEMNQNDNINEPQKGRKWAPGKLQNHLFPLCFRLNGKPEGDPKRAPEMGPTRAQFWVKMSPQNGLQNDPGIGPILRQNVAEIKQNPSFPLTFWAKSIKM